jgi:hypothetical protein
LDSRQGLVGKLFLDSSEVEPGAFSADQAAAEIKDVEKARSDWAPASLEPEGPTDRGRVQDRLVDDVVVPVPASNGLKTVDSQIGEQVSIERLDLVAAVKRIAGASDDIVLGVGAEPLDDRLKVASFFGSVVPLHECIHLLSSDGRSPFAHSGLRSSTLSSRGRLFRGLGRDWMFGCRIELPLPPRGVEVG